MAGNLVIVESPAKAKTIQKYLGKEFTVKSSFGHIRDLQDKKLSVDVADGFKPEYVVPAAKKKVVAELKKAADDAALVWLASDEDREGEAISWHLVETLGLDRSRTRRIVFHEITKDAILHAIETPRDIDDNLVKAQQARRVLDRLVGFELSPILWRKIQRGLSAGRVQSVALRLVVDREKEIIAFQNTPYYKVEAQFVVDGVKVKGLLDTRFETLEQARAFLEESIGASYTVASVEKKDAVRFPAAPFTTSTLQQEAARKLRYPVSLTMRLAQGLYERGLITYMRTDSTNLSALALGTAKQFILDNFGPEYSHPRQYKTRSKGAQEAHEAIRPTFIANTDIEGTAQEKKLYELIWKRTVASQMVEAKVLGTSIKVASDKRSEQYGIQATEVLFDGFLKLYMEGSDDEVQEDNTILPPMQVGNPIQMRSVAAECKFSQAPARYSEATLVKKLEELGIGRPSTYAPTISTLTTGRGYIFKGDVEGRKVPVTNLTLKGGTVTASAKTETVGAERGKLIPQEIGIVVSDYLVENFPRIMDYDFTATVEQDFDSIAEGKQVWNEVISSFYGDFHQKVDATMHDGQYTHVERVLGVDPADGRQVVARFGQFGAYVQKGDGEDRQSASLAKGQLIETLTLEEALKLLEFPRRVGNYEGIDIQVLKGRFGPYLKYGDKNISLPRGADPLRISPEECIQLVKDAVSGASATPVLKEFEAAGISVLNGRYGPYIKYDGRNFRIPRGTDAAALTEEDCRRIIAEAPAPDAAARPRRFKKKQ
ncbi:MAG: type I DNA topoisomerase [Bacteroidales bacterium]|nr:type I DNA topoisomerase [Bacteroidales bacterium]MDY6444978.1 type I DNA topoisomerase [Bacteroidales bacterium]